MAEEKLEVVGEVAERVFLVRGWWLWWSVEGVGHGVFGTETACRVGGGWAFAWT